MAWAALLVSNGTQVWGAEAQGTIADDSCVAATIESPGLSKRIDDVLSTFTQKGHPGVMLALAAGGVVRHLKGYGPADLRYGTQWNAAMRYPVGSMTESFTASIVLDLAAAGRVSLTDAITQYIPSLPQAARVITLRNLLTMSSGLWDTEELMEVAGDALIGSPASDVSISTVDAESYVSHQKTLDFRPGTRYRHSSTNYRLLARVIEKATGTPFAAAVGESAFASASMEHSAVVAARNSLLRCSAVPYQADTDHWRNLDAVALATSGDGSIVTNMLDMLSWIRYMTKPTADGESRFVQQADLNNRIAAPGAFYRVGLALFRHAGYVGAGNIGETGSLYVYFPDLSLALVLFSNGFDGADRSAARLRQLTARLVDAYLETYPETGQHAPRFARNAVTLPLVTEKLPSSLFADGTYVSRTTGEVLDVESVGARASVKLMGRSLESWWLMNGRWHGAGAQAHVMLRPGKRSEIGVTEFGEHDSSVARSFIRVAESAVAPRIAQDLAGWYFSDALQTYYRIGVADDAPYLAIKSDLRPGARRPLRQLAPGLFSAGDLILVKKGSAACERGGFTVSSARVRNVPFLRVADDSSRPGHDRLEQADLGLRRSVDCRTGGGSVGNGVSQVRASFQPGSGDHAHGK